MRVKISLESTAKGKYNRKDKRSGANSETLILEY